MRTKWCLVILILFSWSFQQKAVAQKANASKPLYSDPIHDDEADPVLIWNPQKKNVVDVLYQPQGKQPRYLWR